MKQYIWFHPLYIKETPTTMVKGQIENAQRHGYIPIAIESTGKITCNELKTQA